MRADRLLSLLMLLQARGRLSAQELGRELEVSERTIYRDVEALATAGIPIYGEPGPDGGFALVDRYRTSLTGLTDNELRALFVLSIPSPLADLGMKDDLRSALRKLAAALPAARRHEEEEVQQRFHLDSTWWQQGQERAPHMQTILQAVWEDQKLRLAYQTPFSDKIERTVDPYGLVAKAGIWYLVYGRKEAVRVQRVSELIEVWRLAESFTRPADFDLASFWRAWSARHESSLAYFKVRLRIAPGIIPVLSQTFGSQVRTLVEQAQPDADGWIQLELSFESFADARSQILGFGRGAEVLDPLALRRSVFDYAEQIVALYSSP